VPQWNAVLIQKKSELITVARQQLADLGAQKNEQEQIIKNAQNNLDAITTSINSTQGTLNSLQNQINTQQAAVNSAKAYNDSAYNIYVSAKAQSDFLSYSYQSALNSNSSMLAAKVLCDFGFGSCGVYNSSQYSYNASIISQYNAASARTSSTYASYTNYNSQYSASLNTLNSLKNQQAQTANILTNLNSQKNQLTSNISAANSKIISLSLQISQALIKFSPLEAAESRIKSDQTIYSETKGAIEARCAEFIAEINDFLLIANQEFIEKASAIDWEVKYTGILDKQRDIELKISNLKDLVSKLDGYLASL
jgi:chromosome segregation ATPase